MSTNTLHALNRARGRGLRGRIASGSTAERALIGLNLVVGATAVAGGLALVVRTDGSLLQAKPAALAGTAFTDWRVPGLLLAALVGGGSLLSGLALWRRFPHECVLATLVALGVVAFELVEWRIVGFQPLEAIVAGLELLIIALAWWSRPQRATREPVRDEA